MKQVLSALGTAGYLYLGPMAQCVEHCVLHALEGMACPRQAFSRTLTSQNITFFQWVRNVGTPRQRARGGDTEKVLQQIEQGQDGRESTWIRPRIRVQKLQIIKRNTIQSVALQSEGTLRPQTARSTARHSLHSLAHNDLIIHAQHRHNRRLLFRRRCSKCKHIL